MSDGSASTWFEENKRYLLAVLDGVRAALIRVAQRPAASEPAAGAAHKEDGAAALEPPSPPPSLEQITQIFGLSPFERRVLLLCAGVELCADFGSLCAAAQNDPRGTHATFGLALALFPDAHWSALAPGAPLRRFRLIEVRPDSTLLSSPLRIDESILHHLTGVGGIDERLTGLLEAVEAWGPLAPSHAALARKVAAIWARARQGPSPLIELSGPDATTKRAIAAAACRALGLYLYSIRGTDLPASAADRDVLVSLWERDARLAGAGLLIDCTGADGRAELHSIRSFAERVGGLVVTVSDAPLHFSVRSVARIEVGAASALEQRELWREALGEDAARFAATIPEVAASFRLDAGRIHAAAEDVRAALVAERAAIEGGEPLLWDAARNLTRGRIEEIAQRIEPMATWSTLVLPANQLELLREMTVHVRRREQVYGEWGFAAKSSRGLGISALFAGPSGTGKTMAAEVLANELRLDLYRIDLSQVVSKYIGETEKNLRRAFDAADEGGAILLFDEADALFGKRSEVKDSHDRYANIEVSYLLQRMEAYRGLAILTTNIKSALDQAFLRRIRFTVNFPFPDAAQRAEIWRRVFPPGTPTEGLDVPKLAQLHAAGGNIHNIALHAAFLAANAGQSVRMSHVLAAARAEYAKLEKPLTSAEIGGWI